VRILVAPDKFKGSLGASEVAQAIAAGLRDVLPDAQITCLPVADGGEGTASVICDAVGGEWHSCEVREPLGRMVTARYATIEEGATAVMEMSEASGLWRLAPNEFDPLRASSIGTGEMLLDATKRGVREIIIGLGGSATNDGGFGMARALGFRFFDSGGRELTNIAELAQLTRIERLLGLELPAIIAAVDVQNHLLGEHGATQIFGKQKGATADQLKVLEEALTRLAEVVTQQWGTDFRDVTGAGAAGGLGFGLLNFCGATIQLGFDVVASRIGLEKAIGESDVVITGEGRLDGQTLQGKGPAGVANLARGLGKRIYAIVGSADQGGPVWQLFDDVFVLARPPMKTNSAIEKAKQLLRERAAELAQRL
jgi:glycerate kinase